MKKINLFKEVSKFFNSKRSNKIFTRGEYFRFVSDHNDRQRLRKNVLQDTTAETYRLLLMNAGFLRHEEAGVYRKLKKIPDDLTYSKCEQMAYPRRKHA